MWNVYGRASVCVCKTSMCWLQVPYLLVTFCISLIPCDSPPIAPRKRPPHTLFPVFPLVTPRQDFFPPSFQEKRRKEKKKEKKKRSPPEEIRTELPPSPPFLPLSSNFAKNRIESIDRFRLVSSRLALFLKSFPSRSRNPCTRTRSYRINKTAI